MKILVVDDQKYVLNGIKKGIDFQKLGFSEAFFAYSAFEAKQIMAEQEIDILLCDIEMPYESGLQLLAWAREKEYPLECVFLTAHADFDYAREAVRLGSFEYILQPARYAEIVSCLNRVIQKINRTREQQKYSAYGKTMYTEKEKLAEIYVRSWFHDAGAGSGEQLFKYIAEAESRKTAADREVLLVRTDLCDQDKEEWEDQLIIFSFLNVLQELWEEEKAEMKMFSLEKGSYLLFFMGEKEKITEEGIVTLLEKFSQVAEQFWGFELALYCTAPTTFAKAHLQAEKIAEMKKTYPNGQPGIYLSGKMQINRQEYEKLLPDKKHWENLLLLGYSSCVLEEARQCMDRAEKEKLMTTVFLKELYQIYMEVLNVVLVKRNESIQEVLQGEDYFNAYLTRSSMETLFYKSTAFFSGEEDPFCDGKKQVEKIKEYIYKNLEHDIRRDDIAEAVYLSPGYVSKLFKKETNQSLKEFITEEKMKMARTMIQTTGLPISIIAVKVGYTNFSHFSQLYRKYYNISPSEERRADKQKENPTQF